jgi:hypothetical protein
LSVKGLALIDWTSEGWWWWCLHDNSWKERNNIIKVLINCDKYQKWRSIYVASERSNYYSMICIVSCDTILSLFKRQVFYINVCTYTYKYINVTENIWNLIG